jgi:asparagine synthase (glutamine-hydrolysing)
MHFHAVVPPPFTILKGVRKLPPATLRRIDPDGTSTDTTWWSLTPGPRPEDAGRSDEDWRDLTLETLRRAVHRRLIADVPVGVLLSGGLDSSLIVGLLAEAGQQLETFSIGFESVGDMEGDEFRYSDIIAERFGTSHHKLAIDSQTFLPNLLDCIHSQTEPMVSHDNIGFYLLSQEVAKHVKVVQSGQGADEVFAGYSWYPPLVDVASGDAAAAYAQVFRDRDPAEYAETVQAPWHGADFSRRYIAEHFQALGAADAVDKALHIDATIMLVDDPVKRVDNMTMAHGLEARVPFLDHEVVELGMRVPARLKLDQGGKGVLKEAGRLIIPHEVIDRPKGYFPVPALKYLRGPYLDLVRDAVTGTRCRERGLFEPAYVKRLLADPEAHITPLQGSKLWQLALLELWFQSQGL